ncbi:ANTAR domain-containing protein [Streptomyces sp. NPDC002564]|uniref:ANTAR domain-containing protein n=1 Tax=Streptomyces sp. NPDC002564 TaxID=3364649 RepID=UPI003699FF0B
MTHDGRQHAEEATDSESTVADLKEEVAQLKQAMHSHATVDQAMGILVGIGQITPDEAWEVLREVSMNTNTKLRDVAETLIDWGCTRALPAEIGQELERRLVEHRGRSQCAEPEAPSV